MGDPATAAKESNLVQLSPATGKPIDEYKNHVADKQNAVLEEYQQAGKMMQLTGRTHCDRIVVFDGSPRLIGRTEPIGIYDISGLTLMGTVVTDQAVGLVNLQKSS